MRRLRRALLEKEASRLRARGSRRSRSALHRYRRTRDPRTALAYVERLEGYCLGFDLASERGHRRDDIREGLRTVGFDDGRRSLSMSTWAE